MKSISGFLLAALLISGTGYTFAKAHPFVKGDTTENVDRHLSGFTSIKIAGPFEVHITQGPAESVKFAASADVIDRIVTEVDGSVLKIHNKHDNWGWGYKSWYSEKSVWHNHKKIVVYVTAKELEGVSVSGSGNVVFTDGITANTLKLRVRGSGDISGKVDVKTLKSHISGSGNMKLSGNAESSTIKVSGSGDFTADNLITVSSAAHVSGSGRAKINASNKVNADVRGSGGVSYTGTAKIINSTKSGSGEISRF
jgi:hypothetical protein